MERRKELTIFIHAFVGWALYTLTLMLGDTLTILRAPIVYTLVAPIFFAVISLIYFKRFNYTAPLQTALIFMGVVIAADFLLVALFNYMNLGIFASISGTGAAFGNAAPNSHRR